MSGGAAEFAGSFASVAPMPADGVPEFAFIGRSNVGKSSLLNMLLGRRGLAKVSQTPGCTRLVNLFHADRGRFRLADLPGYGYAKVGKSGREGFARLIVDYMEAREAATTVLVLVDGRHEPQRIDLEFLEWLGGTGRPFVIVLTKADKVRAGRLEANRAALLEALGHPDLEVFTTSAAKGLGRKELLGFLGRRAEEMR
jgi:GTP-binding protein